MYTDSILHLFKTKHFFRRFAGHLLEKLLKNSYIKTYANKDLVFIDNVNKIGVVLNGGVYIKNHHIDNLSHPTLLHKATEGDILGFIEGDGGLTGNPLTWMITASHSDILVIDKSDFIELWNS